MKKILFLCAMLSLIAPAHAQSIDLENLLKQGLSADKTAEYNQVFDKIDTNHDGYLSEKESFKFQQLGIAQDEDNTHSLFDTDENGYVSEDEFIKLYKKQSLQNISESDLAKKFKNMDSNQDGKVSPDEFNTYRLNNLEGQNREILKIMDINGDGAVSKEEFSEFMSFANGILSN